MTEVSDLWTRLGWRRATALSIHFFPTLHPTSIPCVTYSDDVGQIYMFAMGKYGPYAWPDRGVEFPASIGIPGWVEIVAVLPSGTSRRFTDWPNAVNASLMLRTFTPRLWVGITGTWDVAIELSP